MTQETSGLAGVPLSELEQRFAQAMTSLDAIRTARQSIDKELDAVWQRVKALQDELDSRIIATFGDAPDWNFLLAEDGGSRMVRYEASNRELDRLAMSGHYSAVGASGYYEETQQRALRIGLVRSDSELTGKVHDALQMLLPFIEPVNLESPLDEVERAYKLVNVLYDSDQDEGILFLAICEDQGRFELMQKRWGRIERSHLFTSLALLLAHVQHHHFYKE